MKLTMRDLNYVPSEVYVLLRVSGVRTPFPSLAVYKDPHRRFYEGGLQVVSDVQVVAASVEA